MPKTIRAHIVHREIQCSVNTSFGKAYGTVLDDASILEVITCFFDSDSRRDICRILTHRMRGTVKLNGKEICFSDLNNSIKDLLGQVDKIDATVKITMENL